MLLAKAFDVMPFIMISTALCVIIGLNIKNKKIKKILIILGFGIAISYVYWVMGIVTPYVFLSSIFERTEGYLWMFAIILFVWLIVSIFIRCKNLIIINNNKIKDIYVRDIDVEYSPAVCSYLMNNKIETKKDLTATLLNLCAKNIVKIEKNENNINIIDLKNVKEAENLAEDEKYAYKMLCSKVTSSKLIKWKNKVEDEYKKYNFSKLNEKPLGMHIFNIYIVGMIAIFLFFLITGQNTIVGKGAELIAKLLFTSFLAAWETLVIAGFTEGIKFAFNWNIRSSFKDTYTLKGAKELSKWKKFMTFINDFSFLEEKGHEDIVLWGKYLSYSIALGINKNCDKEIYKKIQKEYSFDLDIFLNISEK